MALTDNDKQALRRKIKDSTLAASIATKIDTPLSSLSNRELQALRRLTKSTDVGTEIGGKVFFPSAVETRTNRLLLCVIGNRTIGNHIATEIGS